MPVLYDGYSECQKCGKGFKWVHFEWLRSKMSSGVLRVEKLPEKPWAKEVHVVDEKHLEYIVSCPACGFYNRFVCETEL